MREIKFRAWDNVKNRIYYVGEELDVAFSIESSGSIRAVDLTEHDWGFKVLHHLQYMQYTGLNDKNGVEIYEGDIILIDNETSCVTFDDGCFCVLGYLGDGRTYPIRSAMFTGKEIKVIGNEYENPELLKRR